MNCKIWLTSIVEKKDPVLEFNKHLRTVRSTAHISTGLMGHRSLGRGARRGRLGTPNTGSRWPTAPDYHGLRRSREEHYYHDIGMPRSQGSQGTAAAAAPTTTPGQGDQQGAAEQHEQGDQGGDGHARGQDEQDFPSLPEPGARPTRTKRAPIRLGNWASEKEVRVQKPRR